MPVKQPKEKLDPTQRLKTRHRGVSYRVRADGSKSYSVYHSGRYVGPYSTEKEALTAQAGFRADSGRGLQPVLPTRMTFAEQAEAWWASKSLRVRPNSQKVYRQALDNVLLPKLGNRRIASITPEDLAKLVNGLEREGLHSVDKSRPARPYAPSSINSVLQVANGIFALARRNKLIASSPVDLLTSDERPKAKDKNPDESFVWDDASVDSLINASKEFAKRPTTHYDYTTLIATLATLGLRIGEALGLQWRDLDLNAGTVRIERQWTRDGYAPPKTASSVRTLPMPPALVSELKRLRGDAIPRADASLFVTKFGKPFSDRDFGRAFGTIRDLAGLPAYLTVHSLRHACASKLIGAGLPATTVASFLGHANAHETLTTYADLFDAQRSTDDLREALAYRRAEGS